MSRIRTFALLTILAGASVSSPDLRAMSIPECIEGGVGHSWCEVSSCSVSCGSGYYACCNDSCICKYDGEE